MGLFEFHIWLKKAFQKDLYDFLKKIYRKTIKYPSERKSKIKLLKRNCNVHFIKKLLDKGIRFPHPIGIVIAAETKIGKNVNIAQI